MSTIVVSILMLAAVGAMFFVQNFMVGVFIGEVYMLLLLSTILLL